MKRKAVVFVLDGLGDRPCAELGGKTPLQYASTPTLDALAASGQCGFVDPIAPGVPVETHTGMSLLMGLAPKQARKIARGPIEAAGSDVEVRPGDFVARFNFATVEYCEEEDNYVLLDRRAGRISTDTDKLCLAMNTIRGIEDPVIRAYPATHHRGVLVIRGRALPDTFISNDLGNKGIGNVVPQIHASMTQYRTSNVAVDTINDFLRRTHDALDRHPVNQKRRGNGDPVANFLLLRGAGKHRRYDNVLNQLGLRVAVVAGERTVLGVGKLFGFTAITDERFTSLDDTDIPAKLAATSNALETHDIVYTHFKATDIASHDRLPQVKANFISKFDQALASFDHEGCAVAVCADHSTDCTRGEHNGDAVPVILNFPDSRVDSVTQYDEISCSGGTLGRISASHFVYSILDAMDCMTVYSPLRY